MTDAALAPAPAGYDPFMAEIVGGDPYPLYERLRRETPRLFLERYDAWFFFGFEDVWRLSKAPQLSVAGGIAPSQLLLGAGTNPFMISQMDPPVHRLFRAAINPLFTAGAAQRLADAFRADARATAARLRAAGGGDLLMDYGGPLAAALGTRLAGLPIEDAPALLAWTNGFFHRRPDRPGDTEVGAAAGTAMIAHIRQVVDDARAGRREPHGGLAVLLAMQRDDPAITDDHVVFVVLNLQIAAGDTVPKGLASAFHRLWETPAERDLLVDRPEFALDAFLEAVRIDMPTQMQGRTAAETFEHDGVTIAAGQKTMFLFASANRDPAEFDEPDSYRIRRGNRRTMAFGQGIHRCLGVHIAEMEGRIAVEEAIAALPGYEVDLAASRQHQTEYVKGWSNLIVTA